MLSRSRILAAIGVMAVVASLTIASRPAQASPRPAVTPLPGSNVPFAGHARVIGNAPGSLRLSVQVWLKPRLAAAQRFATAVSTSGTPLFHHYLGPASYTARFGPTRAQERAVASWLRSQGFTAIQGGPGRSYVRATAPISKIDSAFRIRLQLYRSTATASAGPFTLRANNTEVSVPAALAGTILGVTGLDNAAPVLPLIGPRVSAHGVVAAQPRGAATARVKIPCSHYYGQHVTASGTLPRQFGTTSFATDICAYDAVQIRSAYGATMASTGKGQTVALVELGLTRDMFLTLQDYAKANHLPAPSPGRYAQLTVGRGTACGDTFDFEEQLDVEASYDMAPGANQIVIGGDTCNTGDYGLQGLFDADLAVLDGPHNRPLATVASNSWEGGAENQAPAATNIEHAYLVQAAAEGVGMYFSTADGSGVYTPSSDPYAIGVGGTTLGIGKNGRRLFETGWSSGVSEVAGGHWQLLGEFGAAGGGPSQLWAQPAYQKHVVPAALARIGAGNRGGGPVRSVPDISADADPQTGFSEGALTFPKGKPPVYGEFDDAGTSLAAPLVAGIVTAAQQGQPHPFGLINPALYQLAGTSAIYDTMPLTSHSPALYRGMACNARDCGAVTLFTSDDQSPDMPGYTGQVTLRGYDNMTGVGTPNGQAFIDALRQLDA